MNEAEVELNRFAQNYPSEQATVKDLRRKIFSFGGTTAHTTVETPKRTRIGFNSPQSESNTEDEFFAIPETPKRAKQNTQQKRTIPITPKKTVTSLITTRIGLETINQPNVQLMMTSILIT